MALTARRAATATCLAIALIALSHDASRAASFDYLYLESNVDGAAGGHVGVAIRGWVYHYQWQTRGRVVLERTPSDAFRHQYTGIENRALTALRVQTSSETLEQLRRTFNQRHLIQRAELDFERDLENDLARLREFAAKGRMSVPGVGLFGREATERQAPMLATKLRGEARQLLEQGARSGLPPHALEGLETLQTRNALEVVAGIRSVRREVLRRPAPESPLAPELQRELTRYANHLSRRIEARVSELSHPLGPTESSGSAESSGPTESSAALLRIDLARLAAVQASLQEKRLVVIDTYPTHCAAVDPRGLDRHSDGLRARLNEASRDLDRAASNAHRGISDVRYAQLEHAGNRVDERSRGVVDSAPFCLHDASLFPSRAGQMENRHSISARELETALASAEREFVRLQSDLDRRYRYDLLSRNCVTELFATIETSLAEGLRKAGMRVTPAAIRAASRSELGGFVEIAGTGNFVPWISARSVAKNYRVAGHHRLAPYRERTIESMKAKSTPWLVTLRESNTVTSRVYHHHAGDPHFLFFTQDAAPLRPILGVANLATAVVETGLGVLSLPFDRGERLGRGALGMLYSLPELAFFNVRKGTLPYVERRRADDGLLVSSR